MRTISGRREDDAEKVAGSYRSGEEMGNTMQPSLSEENRHVSLKRAQVYQWLSNTFTRETSEEMLAYYSTQDGAMFLDSLTEVPGLEVGIQTLLKLIRQHQDTSELALQLAGAYSQLFLGVGGARSAPPYESVYTSERGVMYQEALSQIRTTLSRLGLNLPENFSEPEDHIAVHLDLMAQLAERAGQMEPDSDSNLIMESFLEQRDFLQQHLMNWVPEFCRRCIEHDPSGFYKGITQVLKAFLKEDDAYLQEVAQAR